MTGFIQVARAAEIHLAGPTDLQVFQRALAKHRVVRVTGQLADTAVGKVPVETP